MRRFAIYALGRGQAPGSRKPLVPRWPLILGFVLPHPPRVVYRAFSRTGFYLGATDRAVDLSSERFGNRDF
jgi:hypothetical protein